MSDPMKASRLARVRIDIEDHALLDPWTDAPDLLADRDHWREMYSQGLDANVALAAEVKRLNIAPTVRPNARQLRFLRELLAAEGQWSGMFTCRRHRKATALELEALKIVTSIVLVVTGDDGFALEPERTRLAWRLTDAGIIAVADEFADEFAWTTQSGEHARDRVTVMDSAKRDRWLALVGGSR